jgi:hypothetical protein
LLLNAQKPIERAQVYLALAAWIALHERNRQEAEAFMVKARQEAVDEFSFLSWMKFYEETIETALSDPSFKSKVLS